ncbi:MAG: hypothetical protein M0Z81_04075 [Deltaproteobacteria bacterium]|nr:hypothetical protein [Deltaproteobacteria bacterium]
MTISKVAAINENCVKTASKSFQKVESAAQGRPGLSRGRRRLRFKRKTALMIAPRAHVLLRCSNRPNGAGTVKEIVDKSM